MSNITLLYVFYLLYETKNETLTPVQSNMSTAMILLAVIFTVYMNVPSKELEEEKKSVYKKLGL